MTDENTKAAKKLLIFDSSKRSRKNHRRPNIAPIEVNQPFERVPQCACDDGSGLPPTKQEKLECRIRGGPCREDAAA